MKNIIEKEEEEGDICYYDNGKYLGSFSFLAAIAVRACDDKTMIASRKEDAKDFICRLGKWKP